MFRRSLTQSSSLAGRRFFSGSSALGIKEQSLFKTLTNENKSNYVRYSAGESILVKHPNHVETVFEMSKLGVDVLDRPMCFTLCDKIKNLTDNGDILRTAEEIVHYWKEEVPREAMEQFEHGKNACDWVYNGITPIGDNGSQIDGKTRDLQQEWMQVAKQAQKSKDETIRIGNLVSRLWSVHVGDIENVYRLSRNLTELFVKGNIKSELKNYVLTEEDKETLKEGDFKDPSVIQHILLDQQKAIQSIVDQSGFNPNAIIPISMDYILDSHRIMVQNCRWVPNADVVIPCGEFKYFPNTLRTGNGYIYLFCQPSEIGTEMNSLLNQLNMMELKKYDPIYIASWLHANFINIHPFADGNGRVVRLLVSAILMRHGLPPFIVTQENKLKYYNAIDDSDMGRSLDDFVEYLQTRIEEVTQEIKNQM